MTREFCSGNDATTVIPVNGSEMDPRAGSIVARGPWQDAKAKAQTRATGAELTRQHPGAPDAIAWRRKNPEVKDVD